MSFAQAALEARLRLGVLTKIACVNDIVGKLPFG